MKILTGKNILVTGCSGGIGSSVCKLLRVNGGNIIGISRNQTNVPHDVKNILDEYIAHDLSAPLPDEILNKTLKRFGKVDILIHSAGYLIPGRINDLSISEINSVINSNLLSTVFVIKSFLPLMNNQHCGQIIVIGSLGGVLPMPYEALYSSVKFGVRGFCLSIAEELKDYGIKISLISPGPVKTKMLDIEAEDDNSIISFLMKPLPPDIIAGEVLKLIFKPKLEVILPKSESLTAMFFSQKTWLFLKCFDLLKKYGNSKLKSYRKKYLKYL